MTNLNLSASQFYNNKSIHAYIFINLNIFTWGYKKKGGGGKPDFSFKQAQTAFYIIVLLSRIDVTYLLFQSKLAKLNQYLFLQLKLIKKNIKKNVT